MTNDDRYIEERLKEIGVLNDANDKIKREEKWKKHAKRNTLIVEKTVEGNVNL